MLAKFSFKKTVLILLIFRIILAFWVWHPDVNNHVDWGIRFFEYGPSKFYAPESNVWNYTWPNQPPGSIYIYALIRKLFEAVFAGFWWVNVRIPLFPSGIITFFENNLYQGLLKFPSIVADFGIAYLIYKFIKHLGSREQARLGALIFLVNPVIWYNSSVWGQTDSLVNFFAFLGLYTLLFSKRPTWPIFWLSLGLYIKMSLAIFVPLFLIILLKKYKVVEIFKATLPSVLTVVALTLPFSIDSGRDPLSWLVFLYQTKIFGQQLEVITANAFNIWALLTGIHEQPHTLPFLGLTYQSWGYILFILFYAPVLWVVWKAKNVKSYFWAFAIAAFASWVLLTNMHERYLYPLFPYFTALAVLNSRLLPIYWTVSGISLLNLYNFWEVPPIGFIKGALAYSDRVIARILGLVNFGLFLLLYKKFLKFSAR